MFKGCLKKILMISIFCLNSTAIAFAGGYEQLAVFWAPNVYQLGNTADNSSQFSRTQEDTFTVFNFDLDWRADNNWSNLNYYKLKPALYYSVVDAGKYYYVGYYFYYPRHLCANPHGNDFTGLVMALEKLPTSEQGRLVNLLRYENGGWIEVDISEIKATDRPLSVTVSAGEHAILVGEKSSGLIPNLSIYKPRGNVRQGNDLSGNSPQYYQLVSLDELWLHRSVINTGKAYGVFDHKADTNNPDIKDLPWRWRYKGISWLSNPAEVFRLISADKGLSSDYIYNPYL